MAAVSRKRTTMVLAATSAERQLTPRFRVEFRDAIGTEPFLSVPSLAIMGQ
jgi:hypothetical protein